MSSQCPYIKREFLRLHQARFIELWKGCDAELRRFVSRAEAKLADLRRQQSGSR